MSTSKFASLYLWPYLITISFWSFSFGRPFRVDSEEITVKSIPTIPSSNLSAQVRASESGSLANAASAQSSASLASSDELSDLVLHQWVLLCEQLAPLIRILYELTKSAFSTITNLTISFSYGCVEISKTALQTLSAQSTARLLNWRETLPSVIQRQPDKTALPHVLLLQ